MKKRLAALVEWWRTFLYGPPCPKHPGHRLHETCDVCEELLGRFCECCLSEYEMAAWNDKYGKPKEEIQP